MTLRIDQETHGALCKLKERDNLFLPGVMDRSSKHGYHFLLYNAKRPRGHDERLLYGERPTCANLKHLRGRVPEAKPPCQYLASDRGEILTILCTSAMVGRLLGSVLQQASIMPHLASLCGMVG